MVKDGKTLHRLTEVIETLWLVRSEALQKAAGEERKLRAELDGQRREQRQTLDFVAESAGEIESAYLLSMSHWLRWSEAECRDINTRIARARAVLEKERAVAREAFGKHQAVQHLCRSRKGVRTTGS